MKPSTMFLTLVVAAASVALHAAESDENLSRVRDAERARIDVMAKVAPTVVCIFEKNQVGGGTGVLITEDGYGLTNFHVIAPMLESGEATGGLADGKLYPLKILGIDPTGDLAMFRLTAPAATTQSSGPPFKAAEMGDSETVSIGDWVFAMGNPFLLAEDFTPTVTHGIVSGVHRYQFGGDARSLVYTDCIQVDASINPGNSGGPLFDMQGRLIGINGRASFEQRGRVNVGLGYAISINQVKRFIPALRAGLLTEHGSLGATTIDLGYHRVIFEKMLDPSVAAAAGIQVGDQLKAFDDREIHSSNQFANILGVFPANWLVRVSFDHEGQLNSRVLRLESLPLNMQLPFKTDPAVNGAEAMRVLGECQTTLGPLPLQDDIRWRGKRETQDAALLPTLQHVFVNVRESADGQGECELFDENGAVAGTFEYNGRTAQKRISDKQSADASAEETTCLNLWLGARRALYAKIDDKNAQQWSHAGGDEYQQRVVDLLEYTPAHGKSIRIAIDPDSHLPVRAFWKPDKVMSKAAAPIELEFEDFRPVNGIKLPHQFRFYVGGALAFVDLVVAYETDAKP